MVKLIGISGSLRRASFNTALLRAATELTQCSDGQHRDQRSWSDTEGASASGIGMVHELVTNAAIWCTIEPKQARIDRLASAAERPPKA
jgi:hypothetical protein